MNAKVAQLWARGRATAKTLSYDHISLFPPSGQSTTFWRYSRDERCPHRRDRPDPHPPSNPLIQDDPQKLTRHSPSMPIRLKRVSQTPFLPPGREGSRSCIIFWEC